MGVLLWDETQERYLQSVEQAPVVCFVSRYCFKIKDPNKLVLLGLAMLVVICSPSLCSWLHLRDVLM